jgi:hypothetical protein
VNLGRLDSAAPADTEAAVRLRTRGGSWPRWLFLLLPLAVFLCALQAVLVILAANLYQTYMSSTLVPIIGFVALLFMVLIVNPLIRLVLPGRLQPFTRAELVTLFAVVLVSSGISTFGLTSQLIPIVHAPWNQEWNTAQRGWSEDLLPYLHPDLYITDVDQVRMVREGVAVLPPSDSASLGEKMGYWRRVAQAVPWSVWIRPLSRWLLFVFASYGMFFFLSHVVLGHWSRREKLIFPLAQLPESLLPERDEDAGWWPPLFRSPLFWIGFGLAALVTAWNASVQAGWIVGLTKIPFGMGSGEIETMLKGTPFEGVALVGRGGARLEFVYGFFAIGIAFLLPVEISFSVWFYFLVGQAIIVVGSWMNYTDFNTDWLWHNHPPSALGAGGLLCFSTVSLWRCVASYRQLGRGRPLSDRLRLAAPLVGLVVCMLLMAIWLERFTVNPASGHGLSLLWAMIFVAVTTLVTLGLMRIVAEGGIYWMQSHVSFFHVYKMLGLGKVLKPLLVGPLLPIYFVLFMDIKTFMAPNLLNAAKMRQDVGGSRVRFHLAIVVGILVSIAVSLFVALVLCYMRGGQEMGDWFYNTGPQLTLDTARSAIRAVPEFDAATSTWYGAGAAWLGLSLFLRQFVFWFPHPIGFIMQVNPLIGMVWASFLIAWIFKSLVVRYGGKATYMTVRVFFLGLIVGEVVSVFVWPVLGILFEFDTMNIDLNRYGP